MKPIRVAGACLNQTPLDWQGNLQHILAAIDLGRQQGAAILCLPELAISGYGCEDTFFSDYVLGQSLRSLEHIIAATDGLVVSVGLPIQHENCVYNTVALIQNRKLLGLIPKQELAGDGIHYEPRWFKRWPKDRMGDIQLLGGLYPFGDYIFEIDGIRLGFEICEDAWNGVRPAQDHYLHNVDVILNPSASHFAFGKTKIRELLVRETSRAFSCAYVYSNLLGNEAGRVIYDGEILIAQNGNLLARNQRFAYQDVQVLSAVIDPATPRRAKKKSFNFAPNPVMPIRGNGPLPAAVLDAGTSPVVASTAETKEWEFYRAATLGLWDYMRKSRSRGFTLSLSGGADSSASAVLVAHAISEAQAALGAAVFQDKIAYMGLDASQPIAAQLLTFVYQGTTNSSDATRVSAQALAAALGAEYHDWNIQDLVSLYDGLIEGSIGRKLDWARDDIARQNIQSRVRAPGIWYMANLKGALLITTSNRSEAAMGYATMDGDTAGGLAPLGGIDKASLLLWLRWAESELGIAALSHVNSLQPSAELRPPDQKQRSENDLMPFAVLDKIEKCAIRDYRSPLETFMALRGLEHGGRAVTDAELHSWIKKFYTLWSRNQWKRERYAPSFHLDDENLDPRTWCRFPILSGSYHQELAELEAYVSGLQ